MKKLLLFCSVLLFVSLAQSSAPPVMETPINGFGTPVTIAISSTTPTMVPSSQASGRIGVFLSNPAPDVSGLSGFLGNCTSTSLASTIRPIHLSTATAADMSILMREDVCLWMITDSTVTATRNLHYQEFKK